jgi:hypothetical protein
VRQYPLVVWADGDTLDYRDPNTELRAIIGEINGGMDRHNIAASTIQSEKAALDTFHELKWQAFTDTPTVTRQPGSSGVTWFEITDTEFEITTGDGVVEITIQADGAMTGGTTDQMDWALGISVDGNVIAATGSNHKVVRETLTRTTVHTVAAGTHTVKAMCRIAPTIESTSTGTFNLAFQNRRMIAHFPRR